MFIFNSLNYKTVIYVSSKGEMGVAYALSLAGGILIILGSIVRVFFILFGIWVLDRMKGLMINPSFSYSVAIASSIPRLMIVFSIIGLIAGVLVLISAMNLSSQSNVSTWGTLIIVFSVISFIGGGGFLIGGILGLVGGILAIISKS